jgi:hypothetical protein
MVDGTARDRAIHHALKAAAEVAAALQAHLIEEHGADPDRTDAQNPPPARSSCGGGHASAWAKGLRAVEAGTIAESDTISLRNQ